MEGAAGLLSPVERSDIMKREGAGVSALVT